MTPVIQRPTQRFIPILLFLLALVLRLAGLETQSMWADEGGTLALAARAPAVILRDTLADVHPPLYYWMLHGWMSLFGNSVAAARGLSALAGALAVLITWALAARWFGSTAGWVAGLAAAISPLAIHYSQEARMYALAMLLAAFLMLALDHWLAGMQRQRASSVDKPAAAGDLRMLGLYLLAAAGLLMTHYFAVTVVAGAALAGLCQLVIHKRYRASLVFVLAHLPLALLYLAAVLASSTRLSSWTAAKQPTAPLFVLSDVLQTFSIGMNGTPAWAWWSLLFGGLALAGLLSSGQRSGRLISVVWLGVPLALMIIISLGQPYYKPRFLLPALPAFHILVGAGAAGLAKRRWRTNQEPEARSGPSAAQATHPPLARSINRGSVTLLVCTALLLASASRPLYREWFDPSVWRDDYRGAALAISTTAGPDDVLILNGQSQIDTLNVYLHTTQPRLLVPRFRPLDQAATEAELAQLAAQHRRIYGLFYVIEESDPQHVIANWLDSHAYPSSSQWYGDLQLRTWETGDLSDQLRPADIQLGGLRLIGIAHTPASLTPGEALRIQLAWRAEIAPEQPLSLFIHLLDAQGQLIAQSDQPLTLQPLTAGSAWSSRIAVLVPASTPAGRYHTIAGVYNPASGQRLQQADGSDTIGLGSVTLQR